MLTMILTKVCHFRETPLRTALMIYSKTSTTDLQRQLYKQIKLDGFT